MSPPWNVSATSPRLKFLALRPPLDSNIFASARKVVLSRSFSLIRHSSLSVYMYRTLPPCSPEETRYYSRECYQQRQIASRRSRWNQKFVTFDEPYHRALSTCRRARFFSPLPLRYFRSATWKAAQYTRHEDIPSGNLHPLRGNTDRLGVPYSSSNDRNSSSFFILSLASPRQHARPYLILAFSRPRASPVRDSCKRRTQFLFARGTRIFLYPTLVPARTPLSRRSSSA